MDTALDGAQRSTSRGSIEPYMLKKILLSLAFTFAFVPGSVSAHQPRLVEMPETRVSDLEISKAYYGELTGEPDVFVFSTSAPFDLYLNLLVPDSPGQRTDITATILKDDEPLTILDGTEFTWTPMFEPFGYDSYLKGPELKTRALAGSYRIIVSSTNNDSKYSLAIGEKEVFDFKETLNALTLVPQLKRSFFEESPISFILSPFGWGAILVLYFLAAAFGLIYRYLLRKVARDSVRTKTKNIGAMDRLLRLAIGITLLLLAITTTWNLFLIFFSGFALFEAIFSWCGLYAALGRNTCPVE